MATTKTPEEKIKEAEQRLAKASSRLKELKARRSSQERKSDSRRKAILGGWLMAERPEMVTEIIAKLAREQDRAAFDGWSPGQLKTPGSSSSASPAGASS